MKKKVSAKICALLILLSLLALLLSGCFKAQLNDGVIVELYATVPDAKEPGDIYHLQEDKKVKMGSFASSNAPDYIEEQVQKSGGDALQDLSDLADYYISEDLEIYLYNDDLFPTVVYFENGKINTFEPLSYNCTQMKYVNGYLYLISDSKAEVEKIDIQTQRSKILTYSLPKHDTLFIDNVHLNSDESLFCTYTAYSENMVDRRYYAVLIYPNGKIYPIEPSDPENHVFSLIFEVKQGYAILETCERSSSEEFFLRLRYIDGKGKELSCKEIDCKEIVARSKKKLFIENSAAYYDGTLYFTVSDYEYFYNYRYDIETDTLYQDTTFKGYICNDYRLLQQKDGKLYTLN